MRTSSTKCWLLCVSNYCGVVTVALGAHLASVSITIRVTWTNPPPPPKDGGGARRRRPTPPRKRPVRDLHIGGFGAHPRFLQHSRKIRPHTPKVAVAWVGAWVVHLV